MINNKIKNLHNNLLRELNNSELPISVIYFILKDLYNEAEKTMYVALNEELLENSNKEDIKEEE